VTALTADLTGRRLDARRFVSVALVASCVAGLTLTASLGDYPADAGPSIHALVSGHVLRAIQLQPLMGSFAVLARLPFALAAALAGGGEVGVYRAGVLPCLLALGAVGLWLGRRSGLRGAGALLVPALAVLNPASLDAVRTGHPEEALGAALVVAAVLLADRHPTWSAVLLGLAIATKQWAILAAVPVVWAAPRTVRLRTAGIAAAVAALLTAPLALGSVTAFSHTGYNAATAPSASVRATVWFLVAHPERLRLHLPAGFPTAATIYGLPAWVGHVSHPLIVFAAPAVGLLVWRRPSRTGDALALLALLLLLRCVLDPANNEYYHLPLLLSLLAYETVAKRDVRGLPLATLSSAAALWLTFDRLDAGGAAPALTNAVYLTWACATLVYLLHSLGPRLRPRDAR